MGHVGERNKYLKSSKKLVKKRKGNQSCRGMHALGEQDNPS